MNCKLTFLRPAKHYLQTDGSIRAAFEILSFDDLSGHLEQDLLTITQGITKRLEQEIREHPDHWFWMHQRWKGSPPYQEEDLQAPNEG